jgi:hypothetical protein
MDSGFALRAPRNDEREAITARDKRAPQPLSFSSLKISDPSEPDSKPVSV